MDDPSQDSAQNLNVQITNELSSDKTESFSSNNVIISIENSKHKTNKIPSFKKEDDTYNDNKNSSNNDLIINIGNILHNELIVSKNVEDTPKGISDYRNEKQQYRGINAALLEVFDYNMNMKEMVAESHDTEGEPLDYAPDRNGFVLKVFSITFFMLLLTALFIMGVMYFAPLTMFFRKYGKILFFVGLYKIDKNAVPIDGQEYPYLDIPDATIMAMSYGMCLISCCHTMPCILIILVITLIAYCCIAGFVAVVYNTHIIGLSFLITSVIVALCMCLACTSFDFTKWILYVIVILAVLAMLGLMVMLAYLFGYGGKELTLVRLILLIVSCLVQSIMLVIELQMILGGKAIELSEDQAFFGAYMLYTSIMDIFLKLVQILGILDSYT